MRNSFFPIALVVVGAGWLVNELHILPEANWIVILGLVVAGVLVLIFDGINASSITRGPLLIAGGVAVYLHQQNGVEWRMLIPGLLMLCGLLMLIARSGCLPESSEDKRCCAPRNEPDISE